MKKIFFSILFFACAGSVMSQGVKISAMPVATGNGSGSFIPVIQDGINKKISADSLAKLSQQSIGLGYMLMKDTLGGLERINVDSLKLDSLLGTISGGGSSKFGKLGEDTLATADRRFNVNANDFEISGINIFSDTQYIKFNKTSGIEIGGGYSGGGTTKLSIGQSVSSLISTSGSYVGGITTNNGEIYLSSTAKVITATVDSLNAPQNMLYVDAAGRIWKAAVPSPGTTINFADNEEATGSTSSTITLAHTPTAGSVKLYKNGVRQLLAKFSVSGTTLTLTDSRLSTDSFTLDYRY